jgi:hypothetical protein
MSFTDEYLSWGARFEKEFPALQKHGIEDRFYIRLRSRGHTHTVACDCVRLLLDAVASVGTKPSAGENECEGCQQLRSGLVMAQQRLQDILMTARDAITETELQLKEE